MKKTIIFISYFSLGINMYAAAYQEIIKSSTSRDECLENVKSEHSDRLKVQDHPEGVTQCTQNVRSTDAWKKLNFGILTEFAKARSLCIIQAEEALDRAKENCKLKYPR